MYLCHKKYLNSNYSQLLYITIIIITDCFPQNVISSRTTHPDVRPDVVVLAVLLQVPLDLLVGHEAVELGVKREVGEHHHLFGQVGSVGRESKSV